METNNIKEILIAGGGTAGWLCAAYLNRVLKESVKITIIASDKLGTIGVGEATFPTMKTTMKFLGFQEEDWMPKCNATYKAALKFIDWKESPGTDKKNSFYHPFAPERELLSNIFGESFFPFIGDGLPTSHTWLHAMMNGENDKTPYVYRTHVEPYLCDAKLSPKSTNGQKEITSYAYHLDAGKLVDYLMSKTTDRGVNHIDDKIVDVKQLENGFIESVDTENSGTFSADFFIDCSGFNSIILGKTLKEPFISEEESLFMNSAVALHCDNKPEQDGILPYSKLVALDAGWSWNIPLFDRNGTGYVYCDQFIDEEKAEDELRSLMGKSSAPYTAKQLKFKVGKYKNVWKKNCLAIGLSGSFLEPLESTSIFFTELQLAILINLFPDKSCPEPIVKRYNDIFTTQFLEVRDFLVLHYILSKREDTPFWKAVSKDTKIPDSLSEKLEFFKYQLPSMNALGMYTFTPKSYVCILDGMGHLPKSTFPLLEHVDLDLANKQQKEFVKYRKNVLASQPTHYDHLKRIYEV